ncbi:hypothetical protein CCAX7_20350 [Capsulimonas corticalis]|uniref:Uncharacterized protein n=1 Tax=Capsulimonas corticalis TaxID=2219043 RepID=A0A402D2H8_9BACT|nr:hypothetical protein [Capsulimonas corticalis]BDI29984.1 hypothetical protein CCAX7_20350 [Capsulimonas corticalis]
MLKSRYYAWLIPYVEGTLDPNRCHLLEKRMSADPKLAAEAEALRRVTSHLRRSASADPPPAVPRSVWPRVQDRLKARGPAPLISPRLAWGGAAAIAIGLAFAVNQHSDIPDDYYAPPLAVSEALRRPGGSLSALTPMTNGTFSGPADTLNAMVANTPSSVKVGSRIVPAPNDAPRASTPPQLAKATPADGLEPLPARFTGRLVGPETAAWSDGSGARVQMASMISASEAPSLSEPALPKFRKTHVAFANKGNAIPATDSASTSENLIATPSATANPVPVVALPAAPSVSILALHTAHPLVASGALPADLFHPAPVVSPDAIGVAGVNRFFRSLPMGARAASRPMTSLAPIAPKALTAEQSVEILRAEAHSQQERGHFSSALDTWRDAVFVSLTAPTYADERATRQAVETLTIVNEAGQLQDLRTRLERQEEFAPDDVVSLRALGCLYTLSGDVEQARTVWSQVTQSGMDIGEDWYQLAGAELIDGNTAAARSAYENAVRPGALPLNSIHRTVAQRWLSDASH